MRSTSHRDTFPPVRPIGSVAIAVLVWAVACGSPSMSVAADSVALNDERCTGAWVWSEAKRSKGRQFIRVKVRCPKITKHSPTTKVGIFRLKPNGQEAGKGTSIGGAELLSRAALNRQGAHVLCKTYKYRPDYPYPGKFAGCWVRGSRSLVFSARLRVSKAKCRFPLRVFATTGTSSLPVVERAKIFSAWLGRATKVDTADASEMNELPTKRTLYFGRPKRCSSG